MMRPESEADLIAAVAGAAGPLALRGGGTQGISVPGDELSLVGLSGVTLYEPGALTLVVQAGTPVAEIDALLAGENQRLAFEPADFRGLMGTEGAPTIGGVIAGNVSGPRRVQAGAARDFALGVRFVDGAGNLISNGGRVMKNVTGYDLVKLLAGSWGTLGVLSEVSLKVLPVAEAQTTLVLPSQDAAEAVDALSRALCSPYDVSGAAYDPARGRAYVRIEGFDASVRYRAQSLQTHLAMDAELLDGDASAELWRDLRDVRPLARLAGDIWRVTVKPSDGSRVVAAAGGQALMDWAGGLVWLCLPEGTDLRARLQGIAGDATLMRASAETFARLGRFHPEAPGVAALSAGLRAKFDPRGILNRGLMG